MNRDDDGKVGRIQENDGEDGGKSVGRRGRRTVVKMRLV